MLAAVAVAATAAAGPAAPQGVPVARPEPSATASIRAAGRVLTDTLWSQALGARKSIVVYLPPSYGTNRERRYPLAIYLHGATGDETNWSRLGRLPQVMDSLVSAGMPEMIVAMPDGDPYSFYATFNVLLDAAGCRRIMLPDTASAATAARDCVAWPHYDDYIAYDVVRHMDAGYRTVANGARRGIAGLSMGGYGAVQLALQYPGTFRAAASHSGVLWPLELAPPPLHRAAPGRLAADSAGVRRRAERFAPMSRVVFGTDSAGWLARDPYTRAVRLAAEGRPLPALFADVGVDDPYFPQTRAFVGAMRARGLAVEYREWPGTHDWAYWRAHVGQSLAWLAGLIGGASGR